MPFTKNNKVNKGRKMSEEHKRKLSESNKINPARYWFGKKRPPHSEETKKKMSISKLGKVLTEEHKNKISETHKKLGVGSFNKGKKRTKEQREKISLSQRGENGPNWKGGVTSVNILVRNCLKYRQWRSDVFSRDNFACVQCGYSKGGIIEADHIVRLSDIIRKYKINTLQEAIDCEEVWNLNNGRTLCIPCHKKTNTWGSKGNKI